MINKVQITNDFHGFEVTVIVPESGILSRRQTLRVRKELCGIDECNCGDVRGPQDGLEVFESVDSNGRERLNVTAHNNEW